MIRLVAFLGRLQSKIDASLGKKEACPEKREVILEKIEVVADSQTAPNEETAVEIFRSTGGRIQGTASSRKAPRTAEEAEPKRWWVSAEAGNRPATVDPPCLCGTAQVTCL
jgi:hypothetical protein